MNAIRTFGYHCLALAAFGTPLALLYRYVQTWDARAYLIAIISFFAGLLFGALLISLLAISGRMSEQERQEGKQ
jgi:hypothetical protein